jgi:hypothetical protein
MAEQIRTLVEFKVSLLPTGSILLEFGHAATPDEYLKGRIQWTPLSLPPAMAFQLADDVRQIAASSRQRPDAGNA